MNAPGTINSFTGLVDLADSRLGGAALLATDDFFAPKENLVQPGPATFDPDRYTDLGKWMDGWESRRKRVPGHDWCVVRLGLPGSIHGVDIDTSHFLGNHPPYASIEGAALDRDDPAAFAADATWREILPRAPLAPGSHNLFPVHDRGRWTHVRLHIYPDGGVARLRVFGVVAADWSDARAERDLAALVNGGSVTAASDMFFGHKENLIVPWTAADMRDGWETRRRRGPGHDWAIVRLGRPGTLRRLEIDTRHFKGNYPDTCAVDACFAPGADVDTLTWSGFEWRSLLARTKLSAHTNHGFERELAAVGPASHLMLSIYPDGGVSRLRAFGVAAE